MAKQIESIETVNGTTTITYDDGTVEVQTGSVTIETGDVQGGISFG